jgi:hypothetical protein
MLGSQSSRTVARSVRMFLAQAAYSVSDQNITRMAKDLRAATMLYEQHPSQATAISAICAN